MAGATPGEGTPKVSILGLGDIAPSVWDAAAGARATPMHQHIWAVSAAEAFAASGRVAVFCAGDRDKPSALAAFADSVGAGGRTLRLLGAEETGEAAPIAYTEEAALAPLAESLRASGAALRLAHYPGTDAFVDALRKAYQGRGALALRTVPWRASPRITLDSSWISPENKLSSGRRSDLRRMRRAAEKEGQVAIDFIAPGAADLGGILNEALSVESAGWKARAGTSILKDEAAERFYRAYALRAARAGVLRVALLRIGGAAAAMQIAVETQGAYWLLKIGYDERFTRCSPGNILLAESIARAARLNLSAYEFLGKESAWTTMWTSEATPLAAVRAYPISWSGVAAAAADGAKMAKRKAAEKLARWRHGHAARAA